MSTVPLVLEPSSEVVGGLLNWPKELRLDLAELLMDSVQDDSSPTSGTGDRELILSRVEAFERSEIAASDWRESLARVEAKFKAAKS